MNSEFSVVVPTYNAQDYIRRCLDSLVCQTFKNFEIVIIDDGSTDKTRVILEEYAKKNSNMRVFYQKNKGAAIAREFGIQKSTGAYCVMVDADDWIEKNTIEKLAYYVTNFRGVDLIRFRYVCEPLGKCSSVYKNCNKVLNDGELFEIKKELILGGRYNNMWGQLFRRELYVEDKSLFKKRIDYGEDVIMNMNLLANVKTAMLVNDVLYHYCKNEGSVTHDISLDKMTRNISDNISVTMKKMKYLVKFNINNIDENQLKDNCVRFACKQIKMYLSGVGCHFDSEKLYESVNDSGLYDFVGKIKIVNCGITDNIIRNCISKKKYGQLYMVAIFLKIKNILRPVHTLFYVLRKK